MGTRKRRKLALVPSAVFGTVFAGVVPAIVTAGAGCGSDDSQKPDAQYYGVGVPCCSVAAIFDASESALSALTAHTDGSHGRPVDGLDDFRAQQFTEPAAFALPRSPERRQMGAIVERRT